ncbi:hypothetical protein RMR21_024440 (plasmid) [Agrobacterium sp. rho-8.1]|nr:hypothetical protein [Agrobacterium sp. rho-8.1]
MRIAVPIQNIIANCSSVAPIGTVADKITNETIQNPVSIGNIPAYQRKDEHSKLPNSPCSQPETPIWIIKNHVVSDIDIKIHQMAAKAAAARAATLKGISQNFLIARSVQEKAKLSICLFIKRAYVLARAVKIDRS